MSVMIMLLICQRQLSFEALELGIDLFVEHLDLELVVHFARLKVDFSVRETNPSDGGRSTVRVGALGKGSKDLCASFITGNASC
jgi:hypothetical protein